jgi:uncharacterized membrane protein
MDCILVVVFKDEANANEGMKALLQLDSDRSISMNRYALVSKREDGTNTVEQANNPGSLGTQAGTSLGSLNGVLECRQVWTSLPPNRLQALSST